MKSTLAVFLVFYIMAFISFGNYQPVLEIESKIDSIVKLQFEPNQPGGVIAIVRPEGAIFKKSYGMADLDKQIENSEKTIFDIASLAKQFTAFAVLMLQDQGKLSLDDDIMLHLPGFIPYPHEVTIRNLLQHTSGIPSTDVVRLLANLPFDIIWTQQDEINLINQYPHLNFEPGSEFLYSNAGYSLLAQIVENVSGLIFPDYMDSNVFEPIGMNSSFVLNKELVDESSLATGYGKAGVDFEVLSDRSDLSYGGGGIFSNLSDMVAWAQNILSPKVAPGKFSEKISTPYNTLLDGDTINYTFGFHTRNFKGLKMVEHSGGVPGFRNQFMLFPEHETIIIVTCNNQSINTRVLANGIADLLFSEHFEVEEEAKEMAFIESDPNTAKRFEGYYLMPDGMEFGFFVDEGHLWLVVPQSSFQLLALADNQFFLKEFDAKCTFEVGENGLARQMAWHQGGKMVIAPRIEEIIEIHPEDLPQFAGKYVQPSLQITYPVLFESGKLIIETPPTFHKYLGFERPELIHLNGDKFYGDWLEIIEFSRDEKGQVNGFVIRNIGRIRDIHFVRAE